MIDPPLYTYHCDPIAWTAEALCRPFKTWAAVAGTRRPESTLAAMAERRAGKAAAKAAEPRLNPSIEERNAQLVDRLRVAGCVS